jgi:hypothetical protein
LVVVAAGRLEDEELARLPIDVIPAASPAVAFSRPAGVPIM